MKLKTVCLAAGLCLAASQGWAQEPWPPAPAGQGEGQPQQEIPSPEKIARKMTDDMNKELQLTEEQYNKLYDLYLKDQKEQLSNRQSGMRNTPPPPGGGGGGMGRPPMGGGRPPMGGGHPPMMDGRRPEGPPPTDAESAEKQQKELKKREKKMRKILTEEQFEKWQTIEASRRPAPRTREDMPSFDMPEQE